MKKVLLATHRKQVGVLGYLPIVFLFLLMSACFASSLPAGTITLKSAVYYGGAGNEWGTSVTTGGGGVFVSGMTDANGGDGLVQQYTNSLTLGWSAQWPHLSGGDYFNGIAVSAEGVYIAGNSYGRTSDTVGGKENKGIVVKFPLTGATGGGYDGAIWDKQTPSAPGAFSYGGGEGLNALVQTVESGQPYVYATGSSQSGWSNGGRFYLSKVASYSTILWTATDTVSNSFSSGNSVTALNSNIYVGGRSDDSGSMKGYLLKYDANGTRLWSRTSVGVGGWYNGITAFNGYIYAVGLVNYGSTSDFLIEKWDENGNLIWSRQYDRNSSEDILYGVTGAGSTIYAAGSTNGNTAGGRDAIILEIGPATGDIVSSTLYGGVRDDIARSIVVNGTDLYMAGETQSYGAGGKDVMVCMFTTGVQSNTAPVADAGTDQTPYVNNMVTLNGSGSYDVDGNLLTYSWAFTIVPQGSAASLVNPTSVNPTFTVDKAGAYVVSLIVNDGTVDSAADTVTISTLNSAPVANAGPDQSVYVGNTVTLDGSGSTDVDGNLLTYSWAFTSKPTGSTATLNNATAVNPTFTVDKAGSYVVSLTVNDGTVNSAADTVTISTLNSAPVANAGPDQSVYVGNTVTLDGSGSTDVDGNLLTYSWAFTTKPDGSTATLNNATAVNPTFTVDKAGAYVVSLTVNDGTVNSAADTVTISTLNSAPVANAGPDQSVYVGNTVTLDGSGSTDVDGNLLTYNWAFTTKPDGSTATLSGTTTVNPTFTVDKAGTYVISLIVNDGTVNSAADTVTISTLNSAPVANAGADQTAYVTNTVTLDGSGSYDVDGNLLTYSWAFTTVPAGSGAALSSSTSVNPTFTVDKAGTYVVSLIVNDGTVNSAADTVTISTLNSAPVANAGLDQSKYVGDTVTLDGSGSSDVDGNALTYSWSFTSRPSGSTAALSNSTSVNPTFTVDKAGTYVASLIVNDGTVNSAPDTITISTINVAPVANAGADQSVNVGDAVTLNGGGSSDADGDTITYSWSFTTRPSGSTAALSGATSANPTFTVDKAGTYVVSLIVNDGTVSSSPDTVTITANEAPEEEIEVEVSIKPETINLKSKGKFKAFIELPEPYSADKVVLATVVCEGAHAIDGRVDGEDRYIATFNTQDLRITASSKKEEEVTLTVSGELEDGTKFKGSDTVKVKGKEKDK